MKRKICDVVFEVLSPSYYRKDSLEVFYAGIELGWRRVDRNYIDPVPYGSKEAAVMQHVMSLHNFG